MVEKSNSEYHEFLNETSRMRFEGVRGSERADRTYLHLSHSHTLSLSLAGCACPFSHSPRLAGGKPQSSACGLSKVQKEITKASTWIHPIPLHQSSQPKRRRSRLKSRSKEESSGSPSDLFKVSKGVLARVRDVQEPGFARIVSFGFAKRQGGTGRTTTRKNAQSFTYPSSSLCSS